MNASIAIRSRAKNREQLRVKSRAKSQVGPMAAQGAVVFTLVFIIASFVLNLSGHILTEGQRAQIKAMSKPLALAKEEDRLMKAAATSDRSQESLEEWADQRGFVRKYAPVVRPEGSYVAQR